MRRCVAIDVDDTVAIFSAEVARVLSRISGKKVPYSKWSSHNWVEIYGVGATKARDAVKEYVDYRTLGITSAIWPHLHTEVERLGYIPLYVTARGSVLGPETVAITQGWLQMMGIPALESQVLPVQFNERKAEVLMAQGYDVVASIEDHTREHRSYIYKYPDGFHVLVDTPINRNSGELLSSHPKWPTYHPKNFVAMRAELLRFIADKR